MLATGEIPGLHGKEDKDLIPVTIKPLYMKDIGVKGEEPNAATLWSYFISRVKDNLHTVLAFSPVGTKFRERSQKFPSLFSPLAPLIGSFHGQRMPLWMCPPSLCQSSKLNALTK
jgi:dynein heavy chain